MNTLKRISTSITAQINTIIDQIENHEAVANVALNDIHEALMNAKIQIKRVQTERHKFQQQLDELKRDEQKWQERALQLRESDHERALECVRRLNRNREESASLLKQLEEHTALERQLERDVRQIESKFEDLKHKRSTLVARQSRAQALKAVTSHNDAADATGVFDRWEQKIMRYDASAELLAEPTDSFASEFENEEKKAELEEILKSLGK